MNPSELYLRVREKEGRLYSDDLVRSLPAVPVDHPLTAEWRARTDSCARLVRYLQRSPGPLEILDLGCGNGWLSHKLSLIPAARLWGVDRGGPELAQAARLFQASNAVFLEADIFRAPFAIRSFDAIILASVIQYFPDLAALLVQLKELLSGQGEIHLLDSPLYAPDEVPAARARTRAYYAGLGYPEMAESYFHHSTADLAEFSPRWHYRPAGLRARAERRLGRTPAPFPWISIQ